MTARTKILVASYLWLAGTLLSLISGVAALVLVPGIISMIMLAVTTVQAAIAIPAAIAVRQGRNWARLALVILALLSVGSLYSALSQQAWATLVLNVALASTAGLLMDQEVRTYCRRPVTEAGTA